MLVGLIGLVDSLQEGSRRDGGSRDGVHLSPILADCERTGLTADDVSLLPLLEPGVGLGSKAGGLCMFEKRVARDDTLRVEPNKHLQIAAEPLCHTLHGSAKRRVGLGEDGMDGKGVLLAVKRLGDRYGTADHNVFSPHDEADAIAQDFLVLLPDGTGSLLVDKSQKRTRDDRRERERERHAQEC